MSADGNISDVVFTSVLCTMNEWMNEWKYLSRSKIKVTCQQDLITFDFYPSVDKFNKTESERQLSYTVFTRLWPYRPNCKLKTRSGRDKTQFTPHFETGQNCKNTEHVHFRNFLSPTVLTRWSPFQFTPQTCPRLRCEMGITLYYQC